MCDHLLDENVQCTLYNGTTCVECINNNVNGQCLDEPVEECSFNIRSKCKGCNKNYHLVNDKCEKCLEGCGSCYNGYTCESCLDGYHINNSDGTCIKCPQNCKYDKCRS